MSYAGWKALKGGTIFPRTFTTVTMIVGAVWIIQGLGIAETGSFMDGRPGWAVAGAVLGAAGFAAAMVRRRRERAKDGTQAGS